MDWHEQSKEKTLKEKIAYYKKQRRQSIVFASITFFVLIMCCLAWFVNNSMVTAEGMKVNTEGQRFDLAVKQETGSKAGIFDKFFNDIRGSSETWADVDGNRYTLADTSGVSSLLVSGDSSLNNASDTGSLQPGSSGSMTFYIIPRVDDLKNVEIEISMIPYGEGSIGNLPEVTDMEIKNLLKGHLLFFTSKTEDGKYQSWMEGNKLVIQGAEFKKEKPYKITVYWVWPRRFGNLAIASQGDYLFRAGSDTANKIIADMNKHMVNYFLVDDIEGTGYISTEMSQAEIDRYTQVYNIADQQIGEKVRYLRTTISADENQ